MILSYKELKKRDVVNIADGRSFGKITDLKLEFPRAELKGITVCEKKSCLLFRLWCKNEIFIDEKHIIRIGGDVILVNISDFNCGASTSIDLHGKNAKPAEKKPACAPPPCPPPCPPSPCAQSDADIFAENARIDFDDY